MRCSNNMRQCALAILNYEQQNGVLPPGEVFYRKEWDGTSLRAASRRDGLQLGLCLLRWIVMVRGKSCRIWNCRTSTICSIGN